MGGRIHGFLGGVFVTSIFTYYTAEYFRKNQAFISRHLRSSNDIAKRIIDPSSAVIEEAILSKKQEYNKRSFGETCKDIWNDEVIRTTNWIYGVNWYELGLSTDKFVNRSFHKILKSLGAEKD